MMQEGHVAVGRKGIARRVASTISPLVLAGVLVGGFVVFAIIPAGGAGGVFVQACAGTVCTTHYSTLTNTSA